MTEVSLQGKKTGLIVLAAGGSSRMNGKPKLLLEFRGKTLLRGTVETAVNSQFDEIVAVLGNRAEGLINEIADLPVQIAVNDNWQMGMSSSIRTGLDALREERLAAVAVVLCDQPLITVDTLNALRSTFFQTQQLIVASKYGNIIGVPALFDREIFVELRKLKGDEGARKVIRKHTSRTAFIAAPEAEFDVDTLDDYKQLIRQFF